jgi:hypothetical protein
MWPDRYSDSRPALSDISGIVKLLLSRGQEPHNRTLSRSWAALRQRNRYFFASSERLVLTEARDVNNVSDHVPSELPLIFLGFTFTWIIQAGTASGVKWFALRS